ncbi:hypothetical protein MOO44_03860 [Nicoliella spurrieriana]|uniref:Uncharacterized protein n=1 Tax=Nicoliella spurrieriana TaxID=2925830 RepID=A0A976X6F4_9LACO|nr:hypothetical protein [Nicoliella spurrieriana]UQS87302.1 hypothetical protein MOO44_03860 [Nicoliella spurrieriana]
MADYQIRFSVDGRTILESEILGMELSRYHHVFDVFDRKGLPISLNGNQQTLNQLKELSLADAKVALAQTRAAMGKAKTLAVFRPELDRSDQMWETIAKHADSNEPLQQAIVEVETDNISLVQFMMFNQGLAKANNLYLPSTIHPEHYYFDAQKGGRQVIVETFGMYKDPSYLDLKPAGHASYPITPDHDDDLIMAGDTFLADNGLNTTIIGMHQLKNKPNGMKVKLGVFLPASAPKEIIEGHKWHLMVEFNNGLHLAAKQHPNFIQKMVFKAVLNKLKRNLNK